MQISPTSVGVQAAGGTQAQAGAKDKGASGEAASNAAAPAEQLVEQLGTSDPDRDAQGQGDGFGDRPKPNHPPEDVLELGNEESEVVPPSGSLPGEPPGELDLLA